MNCCNISMLAKLSLAFLFSSCYALTITRHGSKSACACKRNLPVQNKSIPRYEHNILTICLSSTTNNIDITEHRTDTKLELSTFNTELHSNTHNNIEDQQESGTCKVKTNRYVAADMPYESAIQTLRAYHNIYGDLVIPRRYIVPSTAGKNIRYVLCRLKTQFF